MKKGDLKVKEGLRPTPKDDRDFQFEKVFGATLPADLPKDFSVSSPLVIKDQGTTDMCTAYALTAVSEDQEGVVLDPFYTFGRTKQIQGGDPNSWGADLRSACKSAVKFGFRPVSDMKSVTSPADDQKRTAAANWENLSQKDDMEARPYAKKSYFAVGGSFDIFDNIRSVIWTARQEKRSVFVGITWKPSWTRLPDGIIDDPKENESGFGHAIKIFGWEGDRALAQLSNGKEIGRGGVFRIHRNVINKLCTFGAFTFMDMPRENAEYKLGKINWFVYWLKSIFS